MRYPGYLSRGLQEYGNDEGLLVGIGGLGLGRRLRLVGRGVVVLGFLSPFSNSDLAEPRFLASFGMAEPPKTRTATTMTTIKRSGPKISPKNTAFSFDVLDSRVVRPARLREGAPFN